MELRRVALAYSACAKTTSRMAHGTEISLDAKRALGEMPISDPKFQTARLFGRDGGRERHVHSMDAGALEHYGRDCRTREQNKLGI